MIDVLLYDLLQTVFCSRSVDRVFARGRSRLQLHLFACEAYAVGNYRFAPNGRRGRCHYGYFLDSTAAEQWNRSLLSELHVVFYSLCMHLLMS